MKLTLTKDDGSTVDFVEAPVVTPEVAPETTETVETPPETPVETPASTGNNFETSGASN